MESYDYLNEEFAEETEKYVICSTASDHIYIIDAKSNYEKPNPNAKKKEDSLRYTFPSTERLNSMSVGVLGETPVLVTGGENIVVFEIIESALKPNVLYTSKAATKKGKKDKKGNANEMQIKIPDTLDKPYNVSISDDGSLLAVAGTSKNGVVLVYYLDEDQEDPPTQLYQFEMKGAGTVKSLNFSCDGKYLAMGGKGGIAKCYYPEMFLPKEIDVNCLHGLSLINSHLLYKPDKAGIPFCMK